MSNKIIDIYATTQVFETDNSNVERVMVVSEPTKVGSIARVSFWIESGSDTVIIIRRGAGLSGDALWDYTTGHPLGGTDTTIIVDTSPVSQYTLTNIDDTAFSMKFTFSVEQIS